MRKRIEEWINWVLYDELIASKINALTRDQADQIMNPHKTEGMAREQLIMDMLTQYLG